MNRIQPLSKRPTSLHPVMPRPSQSCSTATACHVYFAPLHYEPNYSYPLVIWFHGPHDNERQINKVLPLVSVRNYVGAAPRATSLSEQDDGSRIRFRWLEREDDVQLAEARLWDCLDGAHQRFNIAEDRVFLAGLECGGTMALRLALRNPALFAGVLSFGGSFPAEGAPLARLHDLRRLPLYFATTAQSVVYPQEQVCKHLRLFHSAGMSVTLRQYPGDDGLTTPMLSDMDRWIMEQITGAVRHAPGDLIEHRSAN